MELVFLFLYVELAIVFILMGWSTMWEVSKFVPRVINISMFLVYVLAILAVFGYGLFMANSLPDAPYIP